VHGDHLAHHAKGSALARGVQRHRLFLFGQAEMRSVSLAVDHRRLPLPEQFRLRRR
jgi:hypothetical protein